MESVLRELRTARQIADDAGVPFHKVDYVIQRLRVTEAARVGIVRLFDAPGVAAIRQTLSEIAGRRRDQEGGPCDAV